MIKQTVTVDKFNFIKGIQTVIGGSTLYSLLITSENFEANTVNEWEFFLDNSHLPELKNLVTKMELNKQCQEKEKLKKYLGDLESRISKHPAVVGYKIINCSSSEPILIEGRTIMDCYSEENIGDLYLMVVATSRVNLPSIAYYDEWQEVECDISQKPKEWKFTVKVPFSFLLGESFEKFCEEVF